MVNRRIDHLVNKNYLRVCSLSTNLFTLFITINGFSDFAQGGGRGEHSEGRWMRGMWCHWASWGLGERLGVSRWSPQRVLRFLVLLIFSSPIYPQKIHLTTSIPIKLSWFCRWLLNAISYCSSASSISLTSDLMIASLRSMILSNVWLRISISFFKSWALPKNVN